jgi:short-subunit dehydrogenase
MINNTALITGASSGIGLEIAKIFANHNINLLLVARNKDKLKNISEELAKKHNIKVDFLSIDISNIENVKYIYNWCLTNNIQIDYLINNAGFGDYGLFANSDDERTLQMINLNITTLTYLTKLFVKEMIIRKNGKILNIGSTGSFIPGPRMSVYFATKSYVLHFTEALAAELKGTGVSATVVCPVPTKIKFCYFANANKSRIFKEAKLSSAEKVAKYGFNAMIKGKIVAIYGIKNYLMVNSARFLPRNMVLYIMDKMMMM